MYWWLTILLAGVGQVVFKSFYELRIISVDLHGQILQKFLDEIDGQAHFGIDLP